MSNRQMSQLEACVQAAISANAEERRAWRCKDRIEKFWRGRGRIVRVRVIETVIDNPGAEPAILYQLESNMIGGLPREMR